MNYRIVHESCGRIRLRAGAYAFERANEKPLEKRLEALPYVISAEVHSSNGGLLIFYKPKCRELLLAFVSALDRSTVQDSVCNEDEGQLVGIDRRFEKQIAFHVVKRYVIRPLLPRFIRTLFIAIKAMRYVAAGLKKLFTEGLTVEVLDAASISAALITGDRKTAGTIMFLLKISSVMEEYTRARTEATLAQSLGIHSDTVWLIEEDGTEVQIPMSELKVGDRIHVRTGSVISIDGTVTDGEATVNESSLTGEPIAVAKHENSEVFASTVIEEGSLIIRVRQLSSNTKISKIVRLIADSESLKAGVQSKAERLADGIVPFSFLAFGLTWLLSRNVRKALSILMVDYSCAIKLSTPISVISAMKEAVNHGFTVKGGRYLEAFANADTIVFDKTGTLTHAQPKLERVIAFNGYSEEEILRTAACLEEHFPHSVANAIVSGAKEKGCLHPEEHDEVEYIVAHGIASRLYKKRIIIGSRHFVCEDEQVEISAEQQAEIDSNSTANSVIYLAIDGTLIGALCVSDPPRKDAAIAIEQLKESGISNVVMLTGDSRKSASRVAEMLGITRFESEVLPEDKHSYIKQLKDEGHTVIMVGDGINDAPALAESDVSVAMQDASDIARDTADITMTSTDLSELVTLRKLSERLMERIKTNYRYIVGFNTTLIALGLVGVMPPATAALLHNTSTMLISAKSMTPLLHDIEITENT